jgi:hypothetical protein
MKQVLTRQGTERIEVDDYLDRERRGVGFTIRQKRLKCRASP